MRESVASFLSCTFSTAHVEEILTHRWRGDPEIQARVKMEVYLARLKVEQMFRDGEVVDSPEGLTTTIAHWRLVAHYRREKRLREREMLSGDSRCYIEVADRRLPIEDQAVQRAEARALIQAILHLPEIDRRIAVLCFVQGQTCPEIGQQLGMSVDAVKMRVSRIRRKLQHQMRWQGFIE